MPKFDKLLAKLSFLMVSHVFIGNHPQEPKSFLKKRAKKLVFIGHPFFYAEEKSSFIEIYEKKEILYRKIKTPKIIAPEILLYLKDFLLTFYLIFFRLRDKFDIYIGVDPLNALVGLILKKLSIAKIVIFYSIDYTPKRFANPVLNFLYHFLDTFCAKNSDYVWNISQRIAKVRETQGVDEKKNLVVPVGVHFENTGYVHREKEKTERNTLVFAGSLIESKGIKLLIRVMKKVIKEVPDAKLEIIGTGPQEENLKKLVEVMNLNKHVRFLGLMNHDGLLKYLPTCGIGLATYLDDPNNIAYFADPTKIKEYLTCGLPVIVTRVPWIAKEIEERPMGIAINYDKKELVDAVIKLLRDDEFYEECRKNAIEFISKLSWDRIFNKAFSRVLK